MTAGAGPGGVRALSRLKRVLRPVKPLLLPVWRRVQPLVDSSVAWQTSPPLQRAMPGPIRPMTKTEFDGVARRYPYYGARGRYLSVAARIAGELIAASGMTTALELGPHLRPVVVGADVIDRVDDPRLELVPPARLLVHDVTTIPWPIADGAYDLFVALQVFEHLGTSQNAAFGEVARVAGSAIISVPIDWDMDDPRNCHHRISRERALSWFLPQVPTRIEVGNPGHRTRLIYVFEDLAATPSTAARGAERGPQATPGLA